MFYGYCYLSDSISSSVVAEIKIVGKYGSTAETAASEMSSRLLNSMINLQPKCICENIITQFSENSTFLFFSYLKLEVITFEGALLAIRFLLE